MELEFEQMEIENKISNSGLEERSSVSPAKKSSSHFDKRKYREDLNKLKSNNLKSKRKNPTYSGIKLVLSSLFWVFLNPKLSGFELLSDATLKILIVEIIFWKWTLE